MKLRASFRQEIDLFSLASRAGARARVPRFRRRARRAVAVGLGPVLAATGAVLPSVPVTVAVAGAGAAAAAAASVATAPAAKASTGASVLVLLQNGESTAPEAAVLQAAGYSVTQASPSTWLGMSAAQFEGYAALVIGDPSASGSCSSLTPTTGTSGNDAIGTTWQSAVSGNVAVLGTAPALPGTSAAGSLISDSVGYAAAGFNSSQSGTPGSGTGLYVSLNCEYSTAAAGTAVPLLAGVEGIGGAGGLTVAGNLSCSDAGTVNTWEAAKAGTFGGFTSGSLSASSWGSACPVDEAFGSWPAMFTPVAFDAASDATGNFTASDGATGQPYVLLGAPVSAATAALAPSSGGEVIGGTTAGGTSNPAAPGVQQASAGDPVNTENGDFSQSNTDFSLPGFGPSLGFTRTYDASAARQQTQTGTPGPMGYGWTDNWATSLTTARPAPGDIYAAEGLRTNNGDGGPALGSIVNAPYGVTVDSSGDVYFSDTKDNRVEEIAGFTGSQWGRQMIAGNVYTVAGQTNGQFELPLDGGLSNATPALQAVLEHPEGVAVDSSGDLFIADTNHCRIVEVEPIDSQGDGGMYTYAGSSTATCGYAGDGGSAISALLDFPSSIHFGQGSQSGDLYIADAGNDAIREVAGNSGVEWGQNMQQTFIYTVAGQGQQPGTGSGVSATTAVLNDPQGVTVYGNNLIIADTGNCRVAEVPQSGGTQFGISMTADNLYDVAGRYSSGTVDCALGNDNKTATTSDLNYPTSVRCPSGTIYIADTQNNRVQAVDPTDNVTTAATGFSAPQDLWPDSSGDLFVADTGDSDIQEVVGGSGSPNEVAGGSAWTLADTGNAGPAVNAALSNPSAVTSDTHGDVYIADTANNRVQEVAAWSHSQFGITMTAGDVYTVAGSQTGAAGYNGDGIASTSALLNQPTGVAVDSSGNLYIADQQNAAIRKVAAASPYDISTIAGTPGATGAFSGNGTVATQAVLGTPDAVAVDGSGDVFLADSANNEVLEVPASSGSQYGISGMTAGDIYVIAGASSVPTAPAAPTGLTVTGTTSSSVSLSWTAPPGTVTGYYVFKWNGVTGTQVANPATTSTTITGLTPSTTYKFFVEAYNSAGTSPESTMVQATTGPGGTVPAAPTGLTVTGTTSSSVSLSWTAPSGTVTGYSVYENGSSTPLSSGVSVSGTTATVSGLAASTHYTFTVAASNSSGTGPQSSSVSVTTSASGGTVPAAPTGLTVTGTTSSSVSLSWTAPSGTVTGYSVYENGSSTPLSSGVTVSGTTATVSGLAASTQYTFTVAASNSAGTGPQSTSVSATTAASGGTVPAAPTALAVTGAQPTSVSLSWKAPSGTVTGYSVYENGSSTPLSSGVTISGTTATVSGLTKSTHYTFTVAAFNSAGTGPQSSSVSVTTPGLVPARGSLLAGSGSDPSGNSGDGGPASAALLNAPAGLAVDAAGNIYVSDSGNNQVREIANGTHTQWGQAMTAADIYTIAGSTAGTAGAPGNPDGDGGQATSATLSAPQQIALDTAGDLYITDNNDNRVREIADANGGQWSQSMTAGDIYNVAGSQTKGTTGDGSPATTDEMWQPYGIGTDPTGDLFILQRGQGFVVPQLQEVTATATLSIPTATGQVSSLYPLGTSGDTGGITITQADGSQVSFQAQAPGGGCAVPYVASGQYCVLPQFPGATLTANSDGTWTYRPAPGGDSYTYAATADATGSNPLTGERNTAGDTLTITRQAPAPGSGGCPSAASSCNTITAASGRTLVVGSNASGEVTSVTDPLGRTWTYGYNSANQLVSAIDPMTNVTSYTYGQGSTGNADQANDLLTITSPNAQPGGPDAGDSTVNVYDTLGRVTSQTDPMGFKTTFNYCVNAAAGNCMDPATGTGYVTIIDPDGNTTVDDYSQGALAAETHYTATTLTSEHDYNPITWGGVTSGGTLLNASETDGNGNTTTNSYDRYGDLISSTSPGPDGPDTGTTGYDSLENENCEATAEASSSADCAQNAGPAPVAPGGAITPPSSAPPEGVTYTLYDTDGNQLYSTTGVYQPGSNAASYLQTAYQLFNGNSVTLNGTTITCAASAPARSLPCATINADDVVIELGYNSAGDLTSSSVPDGNGSETATTTYSYNADGEQASTTKPDGNLSGANAGNYTTVDAYNADGEMTGETQAGGTGATVTPRTTSYGYDADGNQVTIKDARSYTTTYTYNADDKVTLATDPDGNATLTCYAGNGRAAQTVPPAGVAAGKLTPGSCPTSYPSGFSDRLAADATVTTYNALGEAMQVTTPAPAGQSGYETSTSTYDGNGQLTESTVPAASTGGKAQVTMNTYNNAGELASETSGYGTASAATTTYCYDPDGDRTAVIAPDGNTSGPAPCEMSSPWAIDSATHPAQAAYQTTYSYDSVGEQVSATRPATTAAPNGAITTVTHDAMGKVLTSIGPDNVTTSYTYTPTGLETGVSYSGSASHPVAYAYDANGTRTRMTDATGTSTYQYDPFGEVTSATNGANQTVSYGHDADGEVTGITYPLPATATWTSSDTISYGFDNADQLTSVTDFNGSKTTITNTADGLPATQTLGTTADTTTTSYDNTDQPSGITLANSSSTLQSFSYSDAPAGNILNETDTPASTGSPATYTYDGRERVSSDTPGTGSALAYSYDASDNLLTLPGGATASYDHQSELTSSTLSGTTTSYSYNADGQRLTSAQGSTQLTSATWNGAGQLTGYAAPAATMSGTVYDGDGLRASATFTPAGGTGVTENYVWDGGSLLMDSANAYIYAGGNAPAEQVNLSTGAVIYLIADKLGSVRGTVSSSGTLTGTTSYDAWGNPQTVGGLSAATPFGYAGGYTDPDGLIYLINRYYDPTTGQFTSVDPDLGQTQQPYAYTGGDPVNGTDPSGLCESEECAGAHDAPPYHPPGTQGGAPSSSSGGSQASRDAQLERLAKAIEKSWGKYWSLVNADHMAAVAASVCNIILQLYAIGYSSGEVLRNMTTERAIRGGSKKKNGKIGYADITFDDPRTAFILVWEVKASGYTPAKARAEAQHYVNQLNANGNTARLGFPLEGTPGFPSKDGAMVYAYSPGGQPGGILYWVQPLRPQPDPTPGPPANDAPDLVPILSSLGFLAMGAAALTWMVNTIGQVAVPVAEACSEGGC